MITIGLLLIGGGCKGLVDRLFTPPHRADRKVIEHTPARS